MNALETLLRRRAGLDKAIAALQEVIESEGGSAATRPTAAEPAYLSATATGVGSASGVLTTGGDKRGARTDTAEAIITEQPGIGVTPQKLADALAERGVPIRSTDPARAARAIGDRVRARNSQVKLESGHFVYRPEDSIGSQPAAASLPVVEQEKAPE